MSSGNKIKNILFSAALGTTIALSANAVKANADDTQTFKPYTPVAYDISEYQGRLTDQQVINLKSEVKFVILRIQDGQYHDQQVDNNIRLMEKYNLPYGVYSFSRYTNVQQAQQEAQRLYSLAPRAKFYVNDFETKYTNASDQSAVSWAVQMKGLTKRPVILYGSQSMLDRFNANTLKSYSAVWLASYNKYMPNPSYNYDLWQYTDKYQSNALGKKLDADTIPVGAKKITFWTGTTSRVKKTAKKAVKHTAVVHTLKKKTTSAKPATYQVKKTTKRVVTKTTAVKHKPKVSYSNLNYKPKQVAKTRQNALKVTKKTTAKKVVAAKHVATKYVAKHAKVARHAKVAKHAKTTTAVQRTTTKFNRVTKPKTKKVTKAKSVVTGKKIVQHKQKTYTVKPTAKIKKTKLNGYKKVSKTTTKHHSKEVKPNVNNK